ARCASASRHITATKRNIVLIQSPAWEAFRIGTAEPIRESDEVCCCRQKFVACGCYARTKISLRDRLTATTSKGVCPHATGLNAQVTGFGYWLRSSTHTHVNGVALRASRP